MRPSLRAEIESFRVMDVLNAANRLERSGRTIFHLEAGQPSTKAPRAAIEAVERAIRSDALGYTEALGIPALRERIAQHYAQTYQINIDPAQVVVTTGSSAGFVFAFLLLFDPGQILGIPNPGYPAYRSIPKALGLNTISIACRAESKFRLTASAIKSAGAMDGLLIASPSNPCGTVIPPNDLKEISVYCRSQNMRLISDEIYHGISYGPETQTALAFDPDAVVINSFSKYFSMTGWRIGWMIVPKPLVATVEKLAQNFYISPPAVSQIAALAAFEGREELDAHVRNYLQNRNVLLSAVRETGTRAVAPADGAFYIYFDISHTGIMSPNYTARLLEEEGIAATPGTDFDPEQGDNWVRLSYAGSLKDISEAAKRLVSWNLKAMSSNPSLLK